MHWKVGRLFLVTIAIVTLFACVAGPQPPPPPKPDLILCSGTARFCMFGIVTNPVTLEQTCPGDLYTPSQAVGTPVGDCVNLADLASREISPGSLCASLVCAGCFPPLCLSCVGGLTSVTPGGCAARPDAGTTTDAGGN